MDEMIIIVVSAAVGVLVGGYLGYAYGRSVQTKAIAEAQAIRADITKVL